MTNRDGREALRGAEEEAFDELAEVLTSKQWAKLLKAPLERAAAKGNRGLAQKLVGAGADMGEALQEAVVGGHTGIVSDLLDNGASLDAKVHAKVVDRNLHDSGVPILHVAARAGKTDIVQLLILKGADIDAMDDDIIGFTPLFLATAWGHEAAALALVAAGAEVDVICGLYSRAAVHRAAEGDHVGILKALVERGADVNVADSQLSTPLHVAAASQLASAEVIDVLVEAGANLEARTVQGFTPLYYAATHIQLETAAGLLKLGADVNARNNARETPLHGVSRYGGSLGAADVVDSLLKSGADETILNTQGQSAADVVGLWNEGEDRLAEEIERVREVLANAPADRAWRRRGYLVMCRAHPERITQRQDGSNTLPSLAFETDDHVDLGRIASGDCPVAVGSCSTGAGMSEALVGLVTTVLGLEEEGIFRTIVGYL